MWLEANEFGDPDPAPGGAADPVLPGLQGLVAALPLTLIGKARLLQRLAGPRHGGLDWLDRLWRRHALLWPDAGLDDALQGLVACALAYRTCAAEPGAWPGDARSAAVWLAASGRESMDGNARLWVAGTIAADDVAPGDDGRSTWDRARQWVLDLECSTLGEQPGVFDADMANLRADAPACSDDAWQAALGCALGRYATMKPLFRSDPIARRFAEPARRNIARYLERRQAVAA